MLGANLLAVKSAALELQRTIQLIWHESARLGLRSLKNLKLKIDNLSKTHSEIKYTLLPHYMTLLRST